MAELLREGKVDLYIDSPFPSLAMGHLSGSTLLARRWKKGVAEYHSIIFARKDSGIGRLEDLKQKIIGFETPYSSSGHFLPKMVLLQQGFRLAAMEDPANAVDQGKMGYTFTGDEKNTLLWVLRGKVSAGVVDDQTYLKLAKDDINHWQIIHRTYAVPRHILSHRSNLPLKLARSIKDVLLKMDQSAQGAKALKDFQGTTKFDDIPASQMAPIRQSWKFIEAEVAK